MSKCISDRKAVYIACPFYKGESETVIRCESWMEGTGLALHMRWADRKKAYLIRHCRSIEGCRRCEIHRMLERAYPDEGWSVRHERDAAVFAGD